MQTPTEKSLGSNSAIMKRKIFEQEQIARAVELGLGAASPSEIAFIMDNEESRDRGRRIMEILKEG